MLAATAEKQNMVATPGHPNKGGSPIPHRNRTTGQIGETRG
ncbi:MAG: hypothetical protein ACI8XO_000820 [Verrucomicrobiales bacterium]|jgi:hypothetical protein